MNKREVIAVLRREEKDEEEVLSEIERLIAEKDEQLNVLAQREVDQEKRLMDGIDRMHDDYKREGEALSRERDHFVNIRRKLRGEMEEPLVAPHIEEQKVLQIADSRKPKQQRRKFF